MAQPLVSLVCGTYSRLKTLQRMVQSVRETLSRTVPLEIIIADNGSPDGTAAWLATQPDIRVIQFGQPVGAIKAFTEAAYQATGKYVLLATDDIWFPDHSIMLALAYLDSHVGCGAVTFAHNKSSQDYRPDVHPARTEDGQPVAAVYPQIALVRKWLGDRVGWWGGRDAVMKAAFTYGGDNFLGAGIVELGYTVEVVDGAIENEDVINDTPRQMNQDRHLNDARLYRQSYPNGPVLRTTPQIPNPDQERLRILAVIDYDQQRPQHKEGKVGWLRALAQYGVVYDYDYVGRFMAGADTVQELGTLATQMQPHLIFTQFHMPKPAFCLDHAQAMRYGAPAATMINWNGDYWPRNYKNRDAIEILRLYDLHLAQNAYFNEALCQEGVCALPLCHSAEPHEPDLSQPHHDVVFTGNGYDESREQLAQFLRALPYNVGIYGGFKTVPSDGNTLYHFPKTYGLYANAKIAISPMQFTEETWGFTSNRTFEILASGGALCLQQHSPGLDEISGLKSGVHYVEWNTLEGLQQRIDYYLTHEKERRQIVAAAFEEFHRNQTFEARVRWVLTEGLAYIS